MASVIQWPITLLVRLLTMGRQYRRTLFFFYDLDVCPITFDIIDCLAMADLERRRRGFDFVHFVLVPGRQNGLRREDRDTEAAVGFDDRIWRLHNLLIPCLGLLPSLRGHTLCATRIQAGLLRLAARRIFPRDYHPMFPVAPLRRPLFEAARAGVTVMCLETPPRALDYVRQWISAHCNGRPVVTITLRHYGFMAARNSNIEAWLRFADHLEAQGYRAVLVFDAADALEIDPNAASRFAVFHAGAWNIWLRSALHELAFLNTAILHGPTETCWYNRTCRYLYFVSYGTTPQTNGDFMRSHGFEINGQLPMAGPLQRLVWKPDDYEYLVSEFEAFRPTLHAGHRE